MSPPLITPTAATTPSAPSLVAVATRVGKILAGLQPSEVTAIRDAIARLVSGLERPPRQVTRSGVFHVMRANGELRVLLTRTTGGYTLEHVARRSDKSFYRHE
jgi:hypothetical protein